MQASTVSQTPVVSALAVGATDVDQEQLQKIFRECGWSLGRARGRSEARAYIDANPVRVVISERDLPEGGWREMLQDLIERPDSPLLVVATRLADDSLWAEVLNMGGYDVLSKPLDREEVTRVIGAAVRHFDNEHQRKQPRISRATAIAAAG